MRYTKSVPAAVLAMLVTAACDTSELVTPEAGTDTDRPSVQQIRTPDDEFARASRAEAPGFAGFYLRDDGTPVVRVKGAAGRVASERYVARQLVGVRRGGGGRMAATPGQPVIIGADYDFAELKGWAEKLEALLTTDGVYSVDVDEVRNGVTVGVGNSGASAAVRSAAARLGIPSGAVRVEKQARPEFRATVRDRFNPLPGGVQIAFSQYLCTLGFNAKRVSNNANIYVTNAHCTGTQYANDGIAIYQNTISASNQIGNEVYDRPLYACTTGVASCRWADAAFISNNGTRTISQGGIARTAWAQNAPAPSLTVTGEYDIVGRFPATSIAVGTWLDKTGRTSGSTYGQVTSSCVTIGVLRCQDISSVWSEGGDSGSPMYVYLGGTGAAENDVQLYGILWGGPNNNWNVTYSSRLGGIETDLGALTNLCRTGYGC